MQYSLTFPTGTVKYFLHSRFAELKKYVDPGNCILLIDHNVASLHRELFSDYRTIIVQADEQSKSWQEAERICKELLSLKSDRNTTLIGVGGGITTDITGFVASVYMRGIAFGFVPTTVLGMCDAAIGGKNGINLGLQKNLIGTILQPSFIFYDTDFLKTLPHAEWSNGFAEVIKYACVFDKELFEELEQHDLNYYRDNQEALHLLIERCVDRKNSVVMNDEKESGNRKLLNFGHTTGHAIETLYDMPHGNAVAVGMVIAAKISEEECGFDTDSTERIKKLLAQYSLPISQPMDIDKVIEVLAMDKKRDSEGIKYILLKKIGSAVIQHLSLEKIKSGLENHSYAGSR